ncbi:MAG: hypothetical protein P8K64_08240 [Acidimicrobiales bacterium]|nr:hypothetical protein [Acidimicrobiales bacterium]
MTFNSNLYGVGRVVVVEVVEVVEVTEVVEVDVLIACPQETTASRKKQ